MTNSNFLKVLSSISFIISASFTVILMLSGVNGGLAVLLTIGCSIILECAKVIFFVKALNSDNLSLGIRTSIFLISALLFASSIVASLSFMFNQANETKNKLIVNSTEYLQGQEQRELIINQIKAIEQEKQVLIQQAESLPGNFYTMKQNIMDKVAAKNVDIENLNKQLQNQKITYNVKDTKGYGAFTIKLAEILRSDASNIELIIFGSLAIVFEIVAGLLFYISQTEASKVNEVNMKNENKIVNLSKKPKEMALIGFKSSNSQISNEHLKKYINYMYESAKDNISLGYKNIGNSININTELARKIKGHLEQENIIKTVGNRTMILKEKSELGLV